MATPQKCTNKGCGKLFTDPEEECVYHPGPPIFHEGQKGWKCCSKRVLTFDEFLAIPPCTTGIHSITTAETTKADLQVTPPSGSSSSTALLVEAERKRLPTASKAPQPQATPTAPQKEVDNTPEEDEPGVTVPLGAKCKRSACGVAYEGEHTRESTCVHHPGVALFHEGSKGWTCCKRRVLEFDEFLKIPGCTDGKHCFVGKKKMEGVEEAVSCRTDFYQTYTHLNVSLFLKKIDKSRATVIFHPNSIDVDLPTTDDKRYTATLPLYAGILAEESEYKVLGTKCELKLRKADGTSWPTLRSDEDAGGVIVQVGRAGIA